MNLVEFLILALATWRIANMIVDDSEDGPFDVLHHIRFMLGERGNDDNRQYIFKQGTELDFWWSLHYQLYRAFSCMWCATFWIGILMVLISLIPYWIGFYLLLPFSLSGGALIVRKVAGN